MVTSESERSRLTSSTPSKIELAALKTSSPGSGMLVIRLSTGRAALRMRRSVGRIRSTYQESTSGSDSRRSVSAVGAQSTTTAS